MTEEHDRALLLLEQIADALRRPISEDEEEARFDRHQAALAAVPAREAAHAESLAADEAHEAALGALSQLRDAQAGRSAGRITHLRRTLTDISFGDGFLSPEQTARAALTNDDTQAAREASYPADLAAAEHRVVETRARAARARTALAEARRACEGLDEHASAEHAAACERLDDLRGELRAARDAHEARGDAARRRRDATQRTSRSACPRGCARRRGVFPGGFVPAHDVSDEVRTSLRACHVDHDACSAEQRSSTGRAAQGPCERGVVDLVAASADDQHAAERGTPAAGAEVTASEGGDTARADSADAELREVVDMLVKADEYERKAAAIDPFDSMRRAPLMYEAKRMRREVEGYLVLWRKSVVAIERRKWAVAIASALDGADRSGCESFVSREEMAASVAAMRAELERERKLRRESEEAFKAANDMRKEESRNEPNVRSRAAKLEIGSRVLLRSGPCRGVVVGWDEEGDPMISGLVNGDPDSWFADDVELDTEATT